MIKRILLVMVLAAFIMPLALAAENETNSSLADNSSNITSVITIPAAPSESAEIRIAHLELMAFIKQIEMRALVSYTDEIGGNSSKLSEILEKFSNQSADISNLSADSDIDAIFEDLKSLISSFKTEARTQIDSNNGKIIDAALKIQDAVSENSAEINELEDDYSNLKEENTLAILDKRVESAQKSLDRLNESGFDTENMQKKLDDIASLRSALKTALEGRSDSLVESVNEQILNLSKELQNLTSSMQAESAEKAKLDFWIDAGSRISKSIKTTISELEDEKINATATEDAYNKIKDNIDDADEALDDGNITEAKAALKELKANLGKVSASYKETAGMKKGVSKVMKGKLESLNAALDKVIKALESEL